MEKPCRALGKGLGEEPEDTSPRTSPGTLVKSLNILGVGLLILQMDKAIPALSSSLTLEGINKTMDVKVFCKLCNVSI